MNDYIVIEGAKEHNLKNISLKIPKNKFIVMTGLSGSGKSSLAFDTIFAEGQRRYVESLSSYARQFLEQLQKPDVEHIGGLSPAIAIEQRTAGGSPRSIVATQTEIYDYLRLLFARIGKPHCYRCGKPIVTQSLQEIVDKICALGSDHKLYILSPVVRGKKGEYQAMFERFLKDGFARVRVDGKIYDLSEDIKLAKYNAHNIEIVVDRIKLTADVRSRVADSSETALKYSDGLILVYDETDNREVLFNSKFTCSVCGISIGEIEPRIFSFNAPHGACPACKGLGTKFEFDIDLLIPDKTRALGLGAIDVWRRGSRGYVMYYKALLRELCDALDIDFDLPWQDIPKATQKIILNGSDKISIWDKPYEGVLPNLERMFRTTDSEYRKEEMSKYMSKMPCPVCNGTRLRRESLSVYVGDKSIWDVVRLTIAEGFNFFNNLKLTPYEEKVAVNIIKEIKKRLKFCLDVGLDYLSLDRFSSTLSGGEAQRIRLATQVGSALSGVIYILDEPTIGLHPRDDGKLIKTLRDLKDLGNTVIAVEHDEQMITAADWLIDLGPGAGVHGGEVVFSGPRDSVKKANTLTARYLTGREKIAIPEKRRAYKNNPTLVIRGASENNLKNIDVKIPLGVFACVTGVSGSGKSSLVEDILYKALARKLYDSREKPGKHKKIEGIDLIDKVIVVDQSPIGRTPRSNPATYTGVFNHIRDFYSQLPEAKAKGFKSARFSFNVSGGRCEACQGDGTKQIEMHFLPDVFVECEVCKGKRFNEATLDVKYKGKNICDVLNMSIEEAIGIFKNLSPIRNVLQTLIDVGLGYLALGQRATTLSGGEAQRIKLASQLRKKATGKTIYILDEPTTGLHFEDVRKLLLVLQRLVDKGNTVLVIEHNLDMIKSADYIIDLGPEGGKGGGTVIACGTPEDIAASSNSYTGKFLKAKL
jgi:excinuclease ABC subunit A